MLVDDHFQLGPRSGVGQFGQPPAIGVVGRRDPPRAEFVQPGHAPRVDRIQRHVGHEGNLPRRTEGRPAQVADQKAIRLGVGNPREMGLLARLLDPRRGQENLRALLAGHAHGMGTAMQLGKIADDAP